MTRLINWLFVVGLTLTALGIAFSFTPAQDTTKVTATPTEKKTEHIPIITTDNNITGSSALLQWINSGDSKPWDTDAITLKDGKLLIDQSRHYWPSYTYAIGCYPSPCDFTRYEAQRLVYVAGPHGIYLKETLVGTYEKEKTIPAKKTFPEPSK